MKLLYLILTHAEAADPQLSANMETLINRLRAEDVAVVTSIGVDNPAVGIEVPQPPLIPANPFAPPVPPQLPQAPELNTAALGFGAPSTAVVAPPPTVPAVPPVSLPQPPIAVSPVAPVPVSAAPVPTPVAAPTSPAGGVQRDAEGLPWDARIHSSSKEMTAKGIWRAKRNLNNPAEVNRIKAELLAAMQANPGAVALAPAVQAPAPAATVAPQVFAQQQQAVATVAAAPVVVPNVPVTAPPMAPPAPVGDTPQSVMLLMAPKMAAGVLTPERQAAVFRQFGIDGIPGLMARPDLATQVKDNLVSWLTHWEAGGTQMPGQA